MYPSAQLQIRLVVFEFLANSHLHATFRTSLLINNHLWYSVIISECAIRYRRLPMQVSMRQGAFRDRGVYQNWPRRQAIKGEVDSNSRLSIIYPFSPTHLPIETTTLVSTMSRCSRHMLHVKQAACGRTPVRIRTRRTASHGPYPQRAASRSAHSV